MNRKKICIAMNDRNVEAWFKKNLSAEFDFTREILHTSMALEVISTEHPDILILYELINAGKKDVNDESMSVPLLVHKIRMNFKGCRIIFVCGHHKEGDELFKKLVTMGVYDILPSDKNGKIPLRNVIDLIYNPQDYSYASQFLGEIAPELENVALSKQATFVDRYILDANGRKKNLPNHTVGVITKDNTYESNNPYNQQSSIDNVLSESVRKQVIQNTVLNNRTNTQPVSHNHNNDFRGIPVLDNFTSQNTKNSSDNNSENMADYSSDTSILTSEDDYDSTPKFTHLVFIEETESVSNGNYDTQADTYGNNTQLSNTQLNNVNIANYTENGYRKDKVLYSDNTLPATSYTGYNTNYYQNNNILPARKQANIIVIAGALAGVGATTTALNIAYTYAKEGKQTLLIDACVGDLSIYSRCGINDNGYNFGDLCSDYVKQIPLWQMCLSREQMQKNSDRYTMYPDTLYFTQISEFTEDNTTLPNEYETIQSLSNAFDVIVVDVSIKTVASVVVPFLSLANKFVLVTTQDLTILNKTKRALDNLRAYAGVYDKLIIGVSKYEMKVTPTVKDIKEYLNPSHCVYILNDNIGFLRGTSDGIIYSSYGKKKVKACFCDLTYYTRKES